MATIHKPPSEGLAASRDAIGIMEALWGWVGPADVLERPRHDVNQQSFGLIHPERRPGSHLTT